ncbi:serine hydrolase [Colwellia sp. BRX10-6]|uniref:serine hydrolase n=1 Tax=unclassified Colwellia TaxID=196834 RepID=UPI0015F477ED|nr:MULTISPECIES: serine hydrolase [unclassified Colwellia]MBA6383056.1 serine hydrolase [Colwellia sp. BRX10-9]MBA6395420.1 serine hydrolase [Colwellia sp. BRX10-6]
MIKPQSKLTFRVFLFLTLTLLVSANNAFANEKKSQIENLVQKYNDYGKFTGSVLVSQSGKIIFKKSYGLANMEWNIPNSPDTKFRIASLTKQFTSMLIMQLVQDNKIKLDAKITAYIPDYRKDTGDKVTVHHLLTHTSGIPSYTSLPDFFSDISRDPYSVDDFTKKYCSGELEFEPGSTFRYNNSGYFLLGNIIEKVTGKTYQDVLQEKIFTPLGMKNSGFDNAKPLIKNRASGYTNSLDGYTNANYLDMSLPYAAGSVYSTVEDLYLWDQALYTEKLLNNKNKVIMFTPYLKNYSYGWGVKDIELTEPNHKIKSIAHSGGINGFQTLITRLPQDQHMIVQLNNTGGAALNEMTDAIIRILYGEAFDEPKKSIVSVLYKTIKEKGIDSAIRLYHDLKESKSKSNEYEYEFAEHHLNNMGYQLLEINKVVEAIEIMKLNTIEHPESGNAYDSLGEAYLVNDQKAQALKSYKKSLELEPDNKHAVTVIKEIESK